MNKIVQSLMVAVVAVCLAISFVGCSEKARSTADIQALTNVIQQDYKDYYNTDGDFDIKYSDSVQKLITNNDNAKVLTNYLAPVLKSSYDFYNLTKSKISDDDWAEEDRIDIYNELNNVKKSFSDFNNAKQRFEDAMEGYSSGAITNIQQSNLTNFIKEYGKFIDSVQKFTNIYASAYFRNFAPKFNNYNGTDTVDAFSLEVALSYKAFTISQVSYELEFAEYYDINKAEFSSTVGNVNSTKLCDELNKIVNLTSKATNNLTDATKKLAYKNINNNDVFYNIELSILDKALEQFDFNAMRESVETELTYISNLAYEDKQVYDEIMYIAYDYIPQVVLNYQTVYNAF